MFSRRSLPASRHLQPFVCLQCSAHGLAPAHTRLFAASAARSKQKASADPGKDGKGDKKATTARRHVTRRFDLASSKARRKAAQSTDEQIEDEEQLSAAGLLAAISRQQDAGSKSLKEALLGAKKEKDKQILPIEILAANELDFQPVEHAIPPIPRLSHGLDRVLFNPGVYRLQDPRSRVYNFDPYLEKIMPASEFDFDALSEYKTSSKDEDLLAMTKMLGTKFTGSTSSMSGVLQHFHFLLSYWRKLNHSMLSRSFPLSSNAFSRITRGPSAIFLRKKGDQYAIDADKSYDGPNIMSWLGHSLEKLLTNPREEFERYRRSSPETAPSEDESGKCFHYSRLGNFLMRSQLDAHDSRLPGSGVFDLKTRAVVSIRMDHTEYETGSGYQIHYDKGEWESYEREFFDMTRATMLKYSLQVRMGRMDGIFVAYHNIERLFGFQYLGLPELDHVLHGQTDPCLGDQEFRLSIRLLDEILQRAIQAYPDTSIRLHFEARGEGAGKVPFMYVIASPVTEEEADSVQNAKSEVRKAFERDVIGLRRDDPEIQAEWQDIQERVDEEMEGDETVEETKSAEELTEQEAGEQEAGEQSLLAEDAEDVTSEVDDATTAGSEGGMQPSKIKRVKLPAHKGPITGWTLAIRNRVNGEYVKRPNHLQPSDNWLVEYHIKEIPKDGVHKLYDQIRQRRHDLIGKDREEQDASLAKYRDLIKSYSDKGREWREKQDKIDAEMGQRMFRPLGPRSAEASAGVQN